VEKAEGQLKERKMLHSFFMQVPAAFCMLKGADHVFELANPAFRELIGNRNPLGKTVRAALPELEDQGLYKLLDEVYQTAKPFFAEGWSAYLMQEDGSLKRTIINFSYQPLTDIYDQTEGILVFAYDVTDQTEAQLLISQSEKKYRELMESLPAAVYTCDQNGYIQLYNEAAARLWGRRPVIGKEMWCGSWKTFRLDGTPLPPEQNPMAVALKEGNISSSEHLIQRPDGSMRNVIPYPQLEKDNDGNIIGALSTLIDITEQVKARKKIEASEQKFRYMANNVPVLIWVSDAEGQRNFFNKSWQNATGRTLKQDAGMGWLETVHEQDVKMFLEQYTSGIENKAPFEIEYRLLRKDGHYRWTISRGAPILDM
jgi:PAS domain S-box-containing protein